MRRWSLNKIMQAVNLWRENRSIAEIAAHLNKSEDEVRSMYPEMKKMGLDKI